MNDTKLLSIAKKLYQIERGAFGSGYPAGVEFAVRPDAISRGSVKEAKTRSREFLESLTDKELSELRTILQIISYRKCNRKGFIRTAANLSVKDLDAWKRKLNVGISRKEVLTDLKKRSTAGIARDLEEYLRLLPVDNLHRNMMSIALFKSKS